MTSYPRPDFPRKSLTWASLNGSWSFAFDDTNTGLTSQWHKKGLPSPRSITVPYAFQTPASGINVYEVHEVLWYERQLTDIRPASHLAAGNRLLLRFGAVDYHATVWVDGQFVGEHRGGHVPFEIDVTDVFVGDEEGASKRLSVRVYDSATDLAQPRGKQFWGPVPESIFYTPTSGIWLGVWVESVPRTRIGDGSGGTVLRSDDVEGGIVHARVAVQGRSPRAKGSVEIEVGLAGVVLGKSVGELKEDRDWVALEPSVVVEESKLGEVKKGDARLKDEGVWYEDRVALWAPEHPILYDLVLRLYDGEGKVVDEVETTTGMRSLDWQKGDGTFRLNGKPYFQMLFLDQGYWPETGLTPPSSEALKTDIELGKALGYNGCRKHQKVEDPRFQYWADRLGWIVWGEMANAYEFGPDYIERMDAEWTEAVKRDINHPCIVTWTPNNESWAYTSLKDSVEQRNHMRSLYYMTKYVPVVLLGLILDANCF